MCRRDRGSPRAVTHVRFMVGCALGLGSVLVGQPAGVARGGAIWHVTGEGAGTPAADASAVYFLTKQHEVIAVEPVHGAARWRHGIPKTGSMRFGSSLIVAGPILVVGAYDLFGLNRQDGAILWRFVPTDGYGPGLYLGAVSDDLIFTGSPAGRVYAVEQGSGKLRWSIVISDEVTTVFEPLVSQAVAFAGYTTFSAPSIGGVVAVDAETGREKWRTPFPVSHPQLAPSFAGGLVLADGVVVAASGDGTIYGLDTTNGVIRWSVPAVSAMSAQRPDFRALARSGRRLIAGSLSGVLICYDLDTLQERWRLPADHNDSVGFRVSTDEDLVYVPYLSGQMVAIDAEKGSELWRVGDGNRRFPWAPDAFADRVFAAGSSGLFSFQR